eukprot:8622875-Karenia_brevis.AAC.1
MPCTGGSPWQHINKFRPGGRERIQKHRRLAKAMWKNFETVVGHALTADAFVVNEWPLQCQYWTDRTVNSFFVAKSFQPVIVHGCMAGLRSINKQDYGVL